MVVVLGQEERISRLVRIYRIMDRINQLVALRAVETDRDIVCVVGKDVAKIIVQNSTCMYVRFGREYRLEFQIQISDKLHLQRQLKIRAADAEVIVNKRAALQANQPAKHP